MKPVFFLLFSSIYCSTPGSQLSTISEPLFGMLFRVFDRINSFREDQNTEVYKLLKERDTLTALINTSSENIKSMVNAVGELIKDEKLYSFKNREGGDTFIAILKDEMGKLELPSGLYKFARILQIITRQLSDANEDKDIYVPHSTVEQFMLNLTDLLKNHTTDLEQWKAEHKETIRKLHAACTKGAPVQPKLENPTPPVSPQKLIPLEPIYDQLKVLLKDQMNTKLLDIFIGLKDKEAILRGPLDTVELLVINLKKVLSPENLFKLKKDKQAPELLAVIGDLLSILEEIAVIIDLLRVLFPITDMCYQYDWAIADFSKFLEKFVSLLVCIKDADSSKFLYLASVQEICTNLEWILESCTLKWNTWELFDYGDTIKGIHENCRHDLNSPTVFKEISDQEKVKIEGTDENKSHEPSEKDELKETKVKGDEIPDKSEVDLNKVPEHDPKTRKDTVTDAETQKDTVTDAEAQKVKVTDA
jgi:hypothetical protein